VTIVTTLTAAAQHEHHESAADPAGAFLMRQASGTSTNPEAAPMDMWMTTRGRWHLMVHGVAFLSDIRQTGPRGRDKQFSTNWLMVSGTRSLGRGSLMLRTMLSAEPATVSDQVYPLLFQTGETAFGRAIIDGQHPHDFFMELAAEYARPFGRGWIWHLYVAPAGDPALGPVAFPHRASAMEIPQAVLSHHFQDSTHIAYKVITTGIGHGMWRIEASAFHGAEPDEERWDLDGGSIDSASVRLNVEPSPRWSMQVSTGYLGKPEKLEPGDERRTTASVSYTLPLRGGAWSSTAVWGQIYKESHDMTLSSWLAESTVRLWNRHHLSGRVEIADKDELFPHPHPSNEVERPALPVATFRVTSMTIGYTFDAVVGRRFRAGVGANTTIYDFPELLEGFYGENPRSTMLFLRVRLGS
jgi:hypothetical protein